MTYLIWQTLPCENNEMLSLPGLHAVLRTCPRHKKYSTQGFLGPASACAIKRIQWWLLLSFLTGCQLSLPKGEGTLNILLLSGFSKDRHFSAVGFCSSISLQIDTNIRVAFHYFSPCWNPLFSCFVIWLTGNKWVLFLQEMSCSSKELK